MIYLDHSSSTFVEEEILKDYYQLSKQYYANTMAIHQLGNEISTLQEKARDKIAQLLHCDSQEVIFTSGASESNSLAIKGYALANQHKGKHIVICCGEHSSNRKCVLQLCEHFGFTYDEIPFSSDKIIDLEILRAKIRKDTILCIVSYVNNELGFIQPIKEIKKVLGNIHFHVDAVQAIGKIEINDLIVADTISMSMHKIHGIKGSGLLIKRKNIKLMPLISGGSQEHNLRAGTHNHIANIIAYKTLAYALHRQQKHESEIKKIWHYAYSQLKEIPNIVINSHEKGCYYILSFSICSLPSQVVLNALGQKQIYVGSISSCCQRGVKIKPALACCSDDPKLLQGVIRISFAYTTTMQEIDQFLACLRKVLQQYG